MVSDTRIDQIAQQLIDLPRVCMVGDNAARKIAEALVDEPEVVDSRLLEETVSRLDEAGEIEVIELDGERAIE
jgi:hypothetical protein